MFEYISLESYELPARSGLFEAEAEARGPARRRALSSLKSALSFSRGALRDAARRAEQRCRSENNHLRI